MEFRTLKRDAFCRGCDKELVREKDMAICFYSMRNRGQNIYICSTCVNAMKKLILSHIEEDINENN